MNVKKTKKFKENCPENYHVHDTCVVYMCGGMHSIGYDVQNVCESIEEFRGEEG